MCLVWACARTRAWNICFHELFSNHYNLYKHLFNPFENQILSLIFFKFVFDNSSMYVCIRVWKKGKEKNSKTERFFPQKKSNDFLAKMVFCFLNCSDLLWCDVKKRFKFDAENWEFFKIFEITWTIHSNKQEKRSEQFSNIIFF